MIRTNNLAINVIEFGKTLLKEVNYVPNRYKCKLADKVIEEIKLNNKKLTALEFSILARENVEYANLCCFCLIVPEFEDLLSNKIKKSFLEAISYHEETSSVILSIFGNIKDIDSDISKRILKNSNNELIKSYKTSKQLKDKQRDIKWQ